MKLTKATLLFMFFAISIFIISSCTSTSSTPTVSNATADATFTPHPTFTSTPIPYELEVQVVSEDGTPLSGASISIKEPGDADLATGNSDDEGQVSWASLNDETATFSIFAQGYIPMEEEVSMTRGKNQAVVTLISDPKGLQIADIVNEGETLLYMEDFQDNDEDFL